MGQITLIYHCSTIKSILKPQLMLWPRVSSKLILLALTKQSTQSIGSLLYQKLNVKTERCTHFELFADEPRQLLFLIFPGHHIGSALINKTHFLVSAGVFVCVQQLTAAVREPRHMEGFTYASPVALHASWQDSQLCAK